MKTLGKTFQDQLFIMNQRGFVPSQQFFLILHIQLALNQVSTKHIALAISNLILDEFRTPVSGIINMTKLDDVIQNSRI